MNRKERRVEAAKARQSQRKNAKQAADGRPLEERLQMAIHEAIARVIPPTMHTTDVPHAEIIRGLGLVAAAFAVQSNVSRSEFLEGMGSYHDGISEALGLEVESQGPTLVLP